jgi:hypothetical protein
MAPSGEPDSMDICVTVADTEIIQPVTVSSVQVGRGCFRNRGLNSRHTAERQEQPMTG